MHSLFKNGEKEKKKGVPHQPSRVQSARHKKMRRRLMGVDESRHLKRVENQAKFAASGY